MLLHYRGELPLGTGAHGRTERHVMADQIMYTADKAGSYMRRFCTGLYPR